MLDRVDVDARDDGCLGRVRRGQDEALLLVLARGERNGQRALHRPHLARQRKLADDSSNRPRCAASFARKR